MSLHGHGILCRDGPSVGGVRDVGPCALEPRGQSLFSPGRSVHFGTEAKTAPTAGAVANIAHVSLLAPFVAPLGP